MLSKPTKKTKSEGGQRTGAKRRDIARRFGFFGGLWCSIQGKLGGLWLISLDIYVNYVFLRVLRTVQHLPSKIIYIK